MRADFRALVALATPVVTVQVGLMAMGVVDTIIVGHVSATDLAAVVTCDKVTCMPVVREPDLRRAGVAQALAQTGAVHDVRVENGKDGHDRFVRFVAATAARLSQRASIVAASVRSQEKD